MAVQSETSRVTYFGNNSTVTPYPVPFKFFENSDLDVSTLDPAGVVVDLVEGVDFTASGAGDDLGGQLVTTAAVPIDTVVIIARNLPATQLSEFEEADRFPARTFEDALDRLTMLVQRQLLGVTQSVRCIPAQGPLNPVTLAPNRILATEVGSNQIRAITGAQLQTLLNLPGTVIDQPTKTFADATQRGLAVPDFLGQIGAQLDSADLYVGTSLVAGGWTLYTVAGAIGIDSLTPESTIDLASDTVPFYDASAGANRKAAIGDMVPAGSITTTKIADGALSADAGGRAKMADQFVTLAKLLSGVLTPVIATKTDTFSYTGVNATVDIPGLSVTVNMPTTSAKVILFGVVAGSCLYGGIRLFRDATAILDGGTAGSRTPVYASFGTENFNSNILHQAHIFAVDSPATTGNVTYAVKAVKAGSNFFVNRDAVDDNAAYTLRGTSVFGALIIP
jgi:hypothetical protein